MASHGKMDYIREHKIHVLFEQLAGTLLLSKPAQPIPFLIEQLQTLQSSNGGDLALTSVTNTPNSITPPPTAGTTVSTTPNAPQTAPEAPKKPKITLAVFGLDAAGKSTLISAVGGEVDRETKPTIGFSPVPFQGEAWDIMMFDLGGGAKFRGIWKEYYSELHGVMFVVDSADVDRFQEAQEALLGIMGDTRAVNKPLLVFANKQDVSNARTSAEIEAALGIQGLPDHHVFGCSAIADPVDENIERGLEWLLERVCSRLSELSDRIKKELQEDKARRAQQMKEQEARVAEWRKEWSKDAAAKEKEKEKEAQS